MPKLLFFAGSARKDSLNKKLAATASKMATDSGADVTFIDMRDFEMPLYDGDHEDENGMPENARKLKEVFSNHDGFFIASPEYNSSFSPMIKNTIDWLSRPHEENGPPLTPFKGKVAAIAGTSPGGLGGLRGLVSLRMLLGNIGVTVIPSQVAIGGGMQAFDDNGKLKDERQAGMLQATIDEFIRTADRLSN
ncbi:MAG: oxidoreductase [Micavibrio sp.]|nr:MAG: oxidoreductase [Micavibrio sp.]